MLGRVFSFDDLLSFMLRPLAFGLVGGIAVAIGVSDTLITAGAVGSIATFIAMAWPHVMDPDRLSRLPCEPEATVDTGVP